MSARRRRMARARRAARFPASLKIHPTWPALVVTGRPCVLRAMLRDLGRDLGVRGDTMLRGRPAIVTISWAVGSVASFSRRDARARQIESWIEAAQ